MPKEQLGNRGSIQRSLQGEIRQDGRSTLVCPACGWKLPAVLCGDPNVPQPGPSCPTPHSQSGNNLQRWDTAAPAPLSHPTVRARCKSIPSSRQARVLRWSCWSQGCFLKAKWVKNPYGVLGSGDVWSWSSIGPSYEELQPTKVTVPGGQVQSEGSGNAWTEGRVWQHQRRKQGHMSHKALLGPLGAERVPQHPLMETSGLGSASCPMRCWWHPVSCPKGPGWTCCYLQCQLGPGSGSLRLQALHRGPPRVPMHRLDGSTAYRPHPDTYMTTFQGQTAGKSSKTIY